MLQAFSKIETLYYALSSIAIMAIPVRYFWRWFRRVDKAVTNEIPHMAAHIKLICKKLGIEVIDLEGSDVSAHPSGDRERD